MDDLVFQGYDETQAYRGRNEYRIYYDKVNNDEVVNKPLFIMDGYDPNDERKIEDFDIGHSSEKSIIDLMKYGNNINLIDSLNHKGFDVIIVNHPVYNRNGKEIDGGSDYIERNAYTFISLLRYIKSIQQGKEKAVVIGPSMGGLITRYALAYMEKKLAETGDNTKWNHNTRLWVSFDSPHQGANIPIGVQKGIQYFAEELETEAAKKFIDEELNKPAPKQMLVNHFTNLTSLPVGAPNFRNVFQNKLNQLGMPQNLRKIALLNGSIFGRLNGVSKGKYLNIDDNLTHIGGLPLINIFADRFIADFYHTMNDKNGTQKHFTFHAGIRGKFLWWTWWTKRTADDDIPNQYKSQPNTKGSYDVSPGGYFNAQQLLEDRTETPAPGFEKDSWSFVLHSLKTNLIDPTHSFIPTKSALAYTGNIALDEVIGNKDRVCSGETPFDSYFAPKNNEEHIHLTKENVTWLTEEIMGNPQNSSIYLRPFTIQGDNTICYSEYKTYTIDNNTSSCQGTTQWTVSNNLTITSQTNNSITIKSVNSSVNGLGWISAKREGGNTVFDDKGIWVGKPLDQSAHFILAGSLKIFSRKWSRLEGLAKFLIPEFEQDLYSFNYEWSIPNSRIRYSDNNRIANINPYNTGTINIGLRLKNRCGCSNWYTRQFDVTYQGGGNTGGGIIVPIRE